MRGGAVGPQLGGRRRSRGWTRGGLGGRAGAAAASVAGRPRGARGGVGRRPGQRRRAYRSSDRRGVAAAGDRVRRGNRGGRRR